MKVICTACDANLQAEYLHEILKVPLCGSCQSNFKHANFTFDVQYCVWCGQGDESIKLFLCDSCPYAFCTKCIARNFGKLEEKRVFNANPWSCLVCLPTKAYLSIKKSDDVKYFNIESVYDAIQTSRIDTIYHDDPIYIGMSQGEMNFISIFFPVRNNSICDLGAYHNYLTAKDIYGVVYSISKTITKYFRKYHLVKPPGLFKTLNAEDGNRALFPHQLSSVCRMYQMENYSRKFGVLRGGILGDDAGLGKTITILSLCLTTIGQLPTQPRGFWNELELIESWRDLIASKLIVQTVLPVLNKVHRSIGFADNLHQLKCQCNQHVFPFSTLKEFFSASINAITLDTLNNKFHYDIAIQQFRFEINELKSNMVKSNRSFLKSSKGKRLLLERSLRLSSATLIVVPLALIEHFYEQIKENIGLKFLSPYSNEEDIGRGVVYIDGLGDIVDIEAPLPKLEVSQNFGISASEMSNYCFVITSFERCAKLQSLKQSLKGDNKDNLVDWSKFSVSKDMCGLSALHGTRFLRLIVDEGHELGNLYSKPKYLGKNNAERIAIESLAQEIARNSILSRDFICEIAAERRWIMSGTPTKGTSSENALYQLQRLLNFLRHGIYGGTDNSTMKLWQENFVKPFKKQDPNGWGNLLSLLNTIMVRTSKKTLKLFEPIRTSVVLERIIDRSDSKEDMSVRAIDRAKANYICDVLVKARHDWKSCKRDSFFRFSPNLLNSEMDNMRRPKAIIFSQFKSDLEGVGHFIYLDPRFGDSSVCEFAGTFKSSELSRFRHSRKKYRKCLFCGHENFITSGDFCDKMLLMVEYQNIDNPFHDINAADVILPSEGGHSAKGAGGHFIGNCLCSPLGCDKKCTGFMNPLGPLQISQVEVQNPNLALIGLEHIVGYTLGRQYDISEQVLVCHIPVLDNTPSAPILWKNGINGGIATIRRIAKCGGRQKFTSWNPGRLLERVRWNSEEEDASILLLHEEGSHGLDLSFVTHIFLLDKIKDPALENQIVSRAYRMGATGPVQVQLLQTTDGEVEV